eukprot:83696_1
MIYLYFCHVLNVYSLTTKANNEHNLSCISWTVKITSKSWGINSLYLVDVVSNRITDFTKGLRGGLQDVYGIGGSNSYVHRGKSSWEVTDEKYKAAAKNIPITI